MEDLDDFNDIEELLAEHQEEPLAEQEAFDEAEVVEALSVSWKDKRQELNHLQKARRFTQASDVRRSFRVEKEDSLPSMWPNWSLVKGMPTRWQEQRDCKLCSLLKRPRSSSSPWYSPPR